MLNKESVSQIQSIANESSTSKAIFSALSERERYRTRLNLKKFRYDLINKGEKIVEDEYLATFKRLQDLGIGALVIGRKGKPNRFLWHYNLKDVATASSGKSNVELRTLDKMKKPVGRPRGRPRKNQSIVTGAVLKKHHEPISITINLSPNVSPEDIGALLALVRDMNK